MKILVITRNVWDDTNAIGNTLSNFFSGIKNLEFASICFRSGNPNNKLCQEYYCLTETEVLKKWFFSEKIGKRFSYNFSSVPINLTSAQKNERSMVRFIRNHNIRLAYWFSNRIWYSKKWQNQKLAFFVESFKPDLVVTFVKSSPQYYLMVKYLRERYNIPVFSWIADDEYTGLLKKKAKREIRNLKYIIDESAVVTGCSQELCEYYRTIFGCNAMPIYKGCDLSTPVKEFVNKPLKIVYAGNLLYGRMDIIQRVAHFLDAYDPMGEKVTFEIYSNTELTAEKKDYFEKKICTKYKGCLDYDSIKLKLSSADIVLHAESFEKDQILKTKYSFSTKIIDCLQSGSVMLAIGPANIASIEYVRKIPGAYVVDQLEKLEEKLSILLGDSLTFTSRSKSIRNFAQKYHNSVLNAKALEDMLYRIIGKES